MSEAAKIDAELFGNAALIVNAYLLNKYGVSVEFEPEDGTLLMRIIGGENIAFSGREPGGRRPAHFTVTLGPVT